MSFPAIYGLMFSPEPCIMHNVWAIVHIPPNEDSTHTMYTFFRDRGISVKAPKPEVISSIPDTDAYIKASFSIRLVRLHIIENIII